MLRPKIQRWLVHQILVNHKEARNSDEELYILYLQAIQPDGLNIDFKTALRKIKNKELPKIASIERERRYWQRKDPATMSDAQVEAARMILESEYREEYGKKAVDLKD